MPPMLPREKASAAKAVLTDLAILAAVGAFLGCLWGAVTILKEKP